MNKSVPPAWPRWPRCSKNAGCSSWNVRQAILAGNFSLPAYPGLIIKDSYWRWPQRNLAGNTIDFFMRVLGLSFHEAMRQITAT